MKLSLSALFADQSRDRLSAISIATRSSIEAGVWRFLEFAKNRPTVWPKSRTTLFFIIVASFLLFSIPLRLIPSISQTLVAQDQRTNATATMLFDRVRLMQLVATPEDAIPIKIEGVVRKPDLTPAQAIVFCLHIQDSTAQLIGRSVTGAQGRYSLAIAATDSQREHLCLYAVDPLNRFGWECRLSSKYARSKELHNIPLVLNESTGRVKRELIVPGGKPMAGIRVKAWAITSPTDYSNSCRVDFAPFEFKAVSDQDGRFLIDGLPSSMHAGLIIESNDWDCLRTAFGTSSDIPDVQHNLASTRPYLAGSSPIKMFPRVDLMGSVVDREGMPVAGARIGFQPETTTDEDGNFTIRRLELNAWDMDELRSYRETIEVEPPGDSRFSRTHFTLDHEQLSSRAIKPVVLEGAWVSGRILSTVTMKPLAGIRVQVEGEHSVSSTSNVDGRFRFTVRPGQKKFRFAPDWMTSEERRQYQEDPKSRAVRQIDVLDNELADIGVVLLDIDTQAVKPLTIRVVMSDGRPVEDCRVFLSQYRSTAQGRTSGAQTRIEPASLLKGDSFEQHILTDMEGIAIVKPAMGWSASDSNQSAPNGQGQTNAANLLTISYPSESPRYFASFEIPTEIPEDAVELKLTEGAQYSGKILLNGSPLVGVTVSFDVRQRFGLAARSLPADLLQTESNGQGEYSLYVPTWNSYTINRLLNFPTRGWAIHPHDPRPISTDDPSKFVFADIQIVSGMRKISGRVVDAEGKPILGASVTLKRGPEILVNQSSTPTDTDGKFLLTNLPEGSVTLEARTRLSGPAGTRRWSGPVSVEVTEKQSEVEIVIVH